MSLLSWVKGRGPSGFGFGSTAAAVTEGLDLTGHTYLVTGSTSGLGLETVRVLALRGARVFATARTREKGERVLSAAGIASPNVTPLACELAEPASVRDCVAEASLRLEERGDKLDGILCNAGIMALPKLELAHGYEKQFFTNHVGHFILVTGLFPQLASEARVVTLSSAAHTFAPKEGIQFDNLKGERGYHAWRAYGQSKLANLLFAKELGQRWVGTGRTANAVHPGVIQSELQRSMSLPARLSMSLAAPVGFKSIPEGAATSCFVATHPSLKNISGEYFADCNTAPSSRLSRDPELAARLWEATERIVAELR